MSRSFDLRTIIMITIGGGILAGMFLLIGVVLCLYTKIAKALNSTSTVDWRTHRGCLGDELSPTQTETSKEAGAVSDTDPSNPGKVTFDKIIQSKPIAAESCPTFQCCDDYSMYADIGTLPPCFCSISEGL
ncbi:protein FAM24B isoform X1 [Peromyscus leucopus]|uniref:protein FAM24B isoform X1 n=1 Tax=Peromyscus leucopus TaxID=10041 RepID=UPI00188511DE|nr:protein FAM24B isoform X1 [Peromyscus leucopus]